jgi:osmotically inducible protein OsmC
MGEVRTAEATWHGDLVGGNGTINYVTSGAISRLPVTWASRTEAHNGKTSPEELIAAAHAACFSMAFSAQLARNGTPADVLEVKASVTFNKVEAGWKITNSDLVVKGTVPGIDDAKFQELAVVARDGCPVSGALKGNVELSVDATLVA